MPDLTYAYEPLYGVEPYKDNSGAGGATVTQDNLIITAWQIADKFGDPPDYVSFDPILKPAAVNTALPATDRVAGTQFANSRHSASFYINPAFGGPETKFSAMGFVMNPPPELRQLLMGAISYNGGDPLDPASYVVSKSLQAALSWRVTQGVAASSRNFITYEDPILIIGTPLFFNDQASDIANWIPYLKTNGADGVAPTFFNVSTPAGVQEMIDAFNSGSGYYVPFTMAVEEDEGQTITITYPHSTARA